MPLLYYESLQDLQKDSDKPLRVATIFSFAANEEQDAIGDIQDESFDVSADEQQRQGVLSAAIATTTRCSKPTSAWTATASRTTTATWPSR